MKTLLAFSLLAALAGTGTATAQQATGEFQPGDLILLRVEAESLLTDTFAVEAGPLVRLPQIGPVSLSGVKRTGLQDHMSKELSRFLRNPMVDARSLVRLSVVGEVDRPGFYDLRGDAAVTSAIMSAGGPTRDAKMDGIRIERGDEKVMDGDELHALLSAGRTVDQMNLRAGDKIVVPRKRDTEAVVRTLGVLVTIPVGVYTLFHLF